MAYNVLTEGRERPVSIWESALGEMSSLPASLRRLRPWRSRSARRRRPIPSSAGARLAPAPPLGLLAASMSADGIRIGGGCSAALNGRWSASHGAGARRCVTHEARDRCRRSPQADDAAPACRWLGGAMLLAA